MVMRIRNQTVAAAVLAAGFSTRMGVKKHSLAIGQETFLSRVCGLYDKLGIRMVLVVGDAGVGSELRNLDLTRVVNPKPELGPLSSLVLALDQVADSTGLLLHPVDHPLVTPDVVEALCSCHSNCQNCILIPSFQGKKGHPVLFPSRFYSDLRQAPLDVGARAVVRANPASMMPIPVSDPGILANLNTPADLKRWNLAPKT